MSIEATSVPMLEDAPTEDLSLGAFPPATIEPPDTSLVEVTPVEGLRSHTDSQSPRQWEDGAGRYDEFELFVCAGNNPDGRLIGRSFFITEEASTGIAMVGQVIEEAKTHFAELQLSAFNLLGKRLPNLEPSYVFNALSAQQRTIFLAPEDVAARYIMAAPYLAVQPSSTGASSVLTMANTSIGHPRRRKRSVDNENEVRITTTIVDGRETKIASNEDLAKGKKRILKLKNMASKATQATTEPSEDSSGPSDQLNGSEIATSNPPSRSDPNDTSKDAPFASLYAYSNRISDSSEL
jgi:hypothetical protein